MNAVCSSIDTLESRRRKTAGPHPGSTAVLSPYLSDASLRRPCAATRSRSTASSCSCQEHVGGWVGQCSGTSEATREQTNHHSLSNVECGRKVLAFP